MVRLHEEERMKKIVLILCMSIFVYAEDNTQFLKEIREIYSKPIYHDLRDFSFDTSDENVTKTMYQDIERILPQYMALNNALYDKNQGKENYGNIYKIEERFPWQYLRRFLQILLSYSAHKDTYESHQILEKTLKNLSQHRKNVEILMNQFNSTLYYNIVLEKMTCYDKRIEQILKKYPPIKKDMIEVIIKSNEMDLRNIEKSFMRSKEGLNQRQRKNHAKLQKETIKYFRIFVKQHNQKIRDTFQEITLESFKEFELYVDKQYESYDSIYHDVLMLISKFIIGIQNSLGIENVYFGYLPIETAEGIRAVSLTPIPESWFTSEEKMHAKYDALLKSCTN